MADDTIALLDALNIERPHVLGISMGGMISQEIAINYPQRVNGLVLGCTTCGPAHGIMATPETMAKLAPNPQMSPQEIIAQFWTAVCSPQFIQSGAKFLDVMAAQAMQSPTPPQTLALQMAAIMQHDTYDRLAQIKAPTLIIHGDVDLLVPPGNQPILAKQIPGSQSETINGVGHMFFWEKPEHSAKSIAEFLSRVPAAA
jgi:pimeloyl-ACP methyl ester carboxylesterase